MFLTDLYATGKPSLPAFVALLGPAANLRVAPAKAAGAADRLWSMEDIAELIDAAARRSRPTRAVQERQYRAAKVSHFYWSCILWDAKEQILE